MINYKHFSYNFFIDFGNLDHDTGCYMEIYNELGRCLAISNALSFYNYVDGSKVVFCNYKSMDKNFKEKFKHVAI